MDSAFYRRHVLGRGAFLALDDVKLDLLALFERLEAVALNGGVMDETILLAVLTLDEAKTLTEKLVGILTEGDFLFLLKG